jgi:Leucine-rich repeat (LRR) protein
MAASWHQLPSIAYIVVCSLDSNRDVLHAAAVCKAWADAASAVVLPAKLKWSSDDIPKDAVVWMKRNWCRFLKLEIRVADGRDQQEAAQQLLADCAAQGASTLQQLSIRTSGLDAVPEATWQLRFLQSLSISKSWGPKLQVAGMTALQQLVLSDCSLQELPDSIGQLQQLTQLTFNQCCYLEALPNR